MTTKTSSRIRLASGYCCTIAMIGAIGVASVLANPCLAQDPPGKATINSSIADDGTGTITVEARGHIPKPPVFYTARANAAVQVGAEQIEQSIQLSIEVIQGEAEKFSFGINGEGKVTDVQGDSIQSWSVRQVGSQRFLDLELKQNVSEISPRINIRSNELQLPATVELTHLTPGESVGFDSMVSLDYAAEVEGVVTAATGFAPLEADDRANRFHTATGGQIKLSLSQSGASPAAVELVDTTVKGEVQSDGNSAHFQLRSTATVAKDEAEITILAGNAAVSELPTSQDFRLRLAIENERPVYKLVFAKAGTFPVTLDFVAKLATPKANGHSMDFTIAASAVVPISLDGLDADLEFHRDQESVVPIRDNHSWLGFLPATGRARMQWKTARKAGEGKLFFTTSGHVEAKVGTGLLRQNHQIDYHVLQGELRSIRIRLHGPGEILDVQGSNIVAWEVTEVGEDRQLTATLSQPITGTSQIKVRSQTAVGAFPVRVEGLRLNPVGAIRHSGYLRLTNLGSVRLEPTELSGLTQLAPEQFPGEPAEARQVFVYRFPAADHTFTVAADRIQPEVNVSELVLYQLTEADRVINTDIELDIREAPIREWDFGIPAEYSVVSVTGASVADYIAASEVADGRRNLKVMFAQDVAGRQLVSLHLEKSESAAAGDWDLPRIEYPDAKTVRGDIGIVGAPGFRIAVVETDLLVEKPLSYFPKPTAGLQQSFRIREPGWSAKMRIEVLQRSVQADVFHLYSLSQETVYGSALINYFVTGAPVSQWRIEVPATMGNVMVDGQDVRTWRREDDTLIVTLHQPVMGGYTLLVTFEEKPSETTGNGSFRAGQVTPVGVQGERGYIQVVSPMQVEIETLTVSEDMLKLDPLELPAEFRLLSTAPPLGTWQYTQRPFDLNLKVNWFEPGTTVTQVVEFSEANSRVSQDGELVTDVLYYVKSRGRRTLKVKLPGDPVRLWEVSVNGQPVTARSADDATLIPLPGGTDPNIPIEVSLRLGKPTVNESNPEVTLPIVFAPVLKTQWSITGDEKRVLVPGRGTVDTSFPVLRPSGFDWVVRRGIVSLLLIGLFTTIGIFTSCKLGWMRLLGLVSLGIAIWVCVSTAKQALSQVGSPMPLQLSLPVLSAGELVQLQVSNTPLWRVDLSTLGIVALLSGIAAIVWSFVSSAKNAKAPLLSEPTALAAGDETSLHSEPAASADGSVFGRFDRKKLMAFGTSETTAKAAIRCGGILLVALGVLLQGGGAPWFYALLGLAILILLFVRPAWTSIRGVGHWIRRTADRRKAKKAAAVDTTSNADSTGAVSTTIALFALTVASSWTSVFAAVPDRFDAAESITQQWQVTHVDSRLTAAGSVELFGKPGDRFLLLKAPAVLTRFEGEGLRLTKEDVPGEGLSYVIRIPITVDASADGENDEPEKPIHYKAEFEYRLESVKPTVGVPVLTGAASIQQIKVSYDEGGWELTCPTAVQIESVPADDVETKAKVLLGPGKASLMLKPKARDVSVEETQFFVEASNFYLPSPGVVDGRHRLHIRTSQGQVSELDILVPKGLTVSEVSGPIGSWQFDADKGRLTVEVEPVQAKAFDIIIDTQRGLDPLPADVNLAPLKVVGAGGEIGLVAVGFGSDAQPEKLESKQMSAVNLGDFDASLIPNKQAVLHRVYRYGADGGELVLRVGAVEPEVRVISKQVLSLGDERVVLGVNFTAQISRAGLFQLSFPLPEGLEVESLSGAALHHWAELSEGDERRIILHLNGKTIGSQSFSLTLSGLAPTDAGDWEVPHFQLNEADRQSGDLVVRPTTGIRLRTVSRQNVSETDPRTLGGMAQGSLAFRLLQRDWDLVLGIEKLDPWVTGHVLHEITLREGQTRSALIANFNIQNASIRTLQVTLPMTSDDETRTLRATGDTVSDFLRTAPDSNIWEVQFKRRVVGRVDFRIEYERRGDRENDDETLIPAGFPQARQLAYYFAVRAGGRLELEHDPLSQGWQRADWNTVPPSLRNSGNRNAPALTLRAMTPTDSLTIHTQRHSLADALKLRVAKGLLTTVLSPTGDQLTAVDVTMEVIRRSSLTVGLPEGGELFSIFVNGESVNSIRLGDDANAWQFYILPGIDDRTATVRFVYTVTGDRLGNLNLTSPELNVPLENIQWNVVAPEGFLLTDNDGNLELIGMANQGHYDRSSYLSKMSSRRQAQAQNAARLLEQANQLLQAGEQTKASWALNSVANQYALDAASNEDARVQLENLQTQQAIVGLNTRRQRLYLDNKATDNALTDNKQLREAAAINPILQQDALNFRPQQLSQLLQGNTTEDNAVLQQIAGRLVQHQRTTEPAPQAIIISLPEEGAVYSFSRSVQVAENTPLELDLDFGSQFRLNPWQAAVALALLAFLAAALTFSLKPVNEV
ncbi:hypothetical protein [Novipirellula aureliae]|nr:hypothetical protein [Novipirellula aureliae]